MQLGSFNPTTLFKNESNSLPQFKGAQAEKKQPVPAENKKMAWGAIRTHVVQGGDLIET